MSFVVVWSVAAEASLRHIPSWREAAAVSRGVYQLAATGKGDLRRRGTSRSEFALYVGSYCVWLSLDHERRQLAVGTVFTARR
jgi:hypothetical protein